MTVTVPGPVLGAALITLVLFGALALAWPAPGRGTVLSLMGALGVAALIWYWRSPGAAVAPLVWDVAALVCIPVGLALRITRARNNRNVPHSPPYPPHPHPPATPYNTHNPPRV
jgi:hypothetical protein